MSNAITLFLVIGLFVTKKSLTRNLSMHVKNITEVIVYYNPQRRICKATTKTELEQEYSSHNGVHSTLTQPQNVQPRESFLTKKCQSSFFSVSAFTSSSATSCGTSFVAPSLFNNFPTSVYFSDSCASHSRNDSCCM